MRKVSILLIFILSYINITSFSQPVKNLYSVLIDYANTYKWNAQTNDWGATLKQMYIYNPDNHLFQQITLDLTVNDSVARTTYFYNQSGKLMEYYSENKLQGNWIYTRKYQIEYDENGRSSHQYVQDFKNGNWVINRRQDYIYSEDNQMIQCFYYGKSGDNWYLSSIETYYYDEQGNLTGSINQDINGINVYQVFYYYDINNKRIGMLVQSWVKSTGTWVDGYRDFYTYNSCGYKIQKLRKRFTKGEWVNELREDYLYKVTYDNLNKNIKIPVCHNGHTIYISENALQAHLNHGDCIGECLVEKDRFAEQRKNRELQTFKPPFTVYPNPAKDMITIRFDKDFNNEIKHIQLTDFYGKLIRTYNISSDDDFTIYRNRLHSGKYFIRLIGEEVFSTMVIFE